MVGWNWAGSTGVQEGQYNRAFSARQAGGVVECECPGEAK